MLPGDGRMVLDVPVATGQWRTDHRPHPRRIHSGCAGRQHLSAQRPGRGAFVPHHVDGHARRGVHPAPLPVRHARNHSLTINGPSQPKIIGMGAETKVPERAVAPSDWHIHYPAGFHPGWIYELIYTAKDPKVMGLGHVAVRDFVSFLKYDQSEANPLRGTQMAYAWGRSQTGRCLRDFVYRGYNADAAGRRVFDGVMPHVAGAGRKWMNHRFANPIVSGGQQYEDHFNIANSFPFSYAWSTDHLTGKQDAILKRPETDPLVFHTQTATEYWVRRGSLAHTDTQGNDLPQPETVRVYCWSSSQHSADPLLKAPAHAASAGIIPTTSRPRCSSAPCWTRWTPGRPTANGRRTAASRRAPTTRWSITRRGASSFPPFPGVMPLACPNALPLLDFGPDADKGILREPPTLVHGRNDPDGPGSELHRAGAVGRSRWQRYSGRAGADGRRAAGHLHRLEPARAWLRSWRAMALRGQLHPVPGDRRPNARRPAIRARRFWNDYPTKQAYQAAIVAAARELVAQGLMLEEDVERCAEMAADWGRPRHDVSL